MKKFREVFLSTFVSLSVLLILLNIIFSFKLSKHWFDISCEVIMIIGAYLITDWISKIYIKYLNKEEE